MIRQRLPLKKPRTSNKPSKVLYSDSEDTGHWTWTDPLCKPDPNVYFGVIYQITNLHNGKKYIGRKNFWEYKNGKRFKESNWRTYQGSNAALAKDIRLLGPEEFKFEILGQYRSRGAVIYAEANLQHKLDVLTSKTKGVKDYYNARIDGIKFIPSTDRSGNLL